MSDIKQIIQPHPIECEGRRSTLPVYRAGEERAVYPPNLAQTQAPEHLGVDTDAANDFYSLPPKYRTKDKLARMFNEHRKAFAAAMQPAPSVSEEADWQWLVGKEFSLGVVDDVSGETATVTRGDDTYRIRISELLEEDAKVRHRQPAAADEVLEAMEDALVRARRLLNEIARDEGISDGDTVVAINVALDKARKRAVGPVSG